MVVGTYQLMSSPMFLLNLVVHSHRRLVGKLNARFHADIAVGGVTLRFSEGSA